MKKLAIAIAVASSALLGASAEAASVSGATSAVQGHAGSEVQKVWYHRHWGHRGWHRGWGHRGWYGHSRYWSHRRHGSWGW